ncbi:enolase C-terminal domain-like protein [Denitromonas iodatirespirans]|uniref:Enolase C-terminal domain-containing protein n=1 Tax=Denitromonas iodatirespirans TaxID=2795389 RepID=A0A944DDC3_DENI1|nr:enolase C-terminal domain-like protein [Denitromonas iodatirespirans]MBT0963387.1 hypothetical protein [Denitromonas iodatirespirans]
MRHAVDASACDLIVPGVTKIGGVSGWLEMPTAAYGIRLSHHLFIEVSTHPLCATPTAQWQEYADPVIARLLEGLDGRAVLDERAGSGIEWNESAVARYPVI